MGRSSYAFNVGKVRFEKEGMEKYFLGM